MAERITPRVDIEFKKIFGVEDSTVEKNYFREIIDFSKLLNYNGGS